MKKIKNILLLVSIFVLSISFTVGCSLNDTNDTLENDDLDTTNEVTNGWDKVRDEYATIKTDAEREIDQLQVVSRDEVKRLVTTVEDGYSKLKNDFDDNDELARTTYKAAHKLEYLGTKYNIANDNEVASLGRNVKTYIENHYSNTENDDLIDNIENGISNIKDYTEDKWNDFINMFK